MNNDKPKKPVGRPVGSTSKLSAKQRALKKQFLSIMDEYTAEAVAVMVEVMRDKQERGQPRVTAALFLCEKTQELIEKILTPEKDGTESDDDEENKSAEVLEMKPKLRLTVSDNN